VVVCGGHREVFCRTRVTDSSPLILEVYVKIYLHRTSGISHLTSQHGRLGIDVGILLWVVTRR
jgi:hypothetical protein